MWKKLEEQHDVRSTHVVRKITINEIPVDTPVENNPKNVTWHDIAQAITGVERRTQVRLVVPDLGRDVQIHRTPQGELVNEGSRHAVIYIGRYKGRKVCYFKAVDPVSGLTSR